MRTFIVTVAGLVLGGSIVAAADGDAAKGKITFSERHCNVCHKTTKDDEKGGKMSTVLGDVVGKMSAVDIRNWLTNTAKMETALPKKPPMPMSSFLKTLKPALTDAEVTNLVAYLQTLPAAKPAVATGGDLARYLLFAGYQVRF